MGEDLYRPRALIAGPHGKVLIGGYPDYGLLGGAIGVYDPKKNAKRVYRHIIRNHSIASLAYIEKLDLIAGGSSIRGGTGTRAIEKEAKLLLWDPKEEKKIFEIVPVPEAKTIFSLAVTVEGSFMESQTMKRYSFLIQRRKRSVRFSILDLKSQEKSLCSLGRI